MKENENNWSLEDLEKIIQSRKKEMPEGSYVASLFRIGTDRIAQKVGEEGVEVAIAATRFGITGKGRELLVGELADLWFFSIIAAVDGGITSKEILAELDRRNSEKNKPK